MKALAVIPLLVVGCVGAVALALGLTGARLNPIDPLLAGLIAAMAAMIGILPVIRLRDEDPTTIVQRALIGTVLHLLGTIVLAGVLFAAHLENVRGAFVVWLLGAYWISLVILVWQLRLVMMNLLAKVKTKTVQN